MNRSQALLVLSECTGDDIWSIAYCKKRSIPQAWIDECRDAYESGFTTDSETIYYDNQPILQFEGLRDVDIACKIAALFRINVSNILQMHLSRRSVVQAIREAIEEES